MDFSNIVQIEEKIRRSYLKISKIKCLPFLDLHRKIPLSILQTIFLKVKSAFQFGRYVTSFSVS